MADGTGEIPAAVADFLAELPREVRTLAVQLRDLVRRRLGDPEERVYRGWGALGFHDEQAGYVCGIFPRSASVRLLFERGASLADPDGLFTGGGRQTRFVELEPADEVPEQAIVEMIDRAVLAGGSRGRVARREGRGTGGSGPSLSAWSELVLRRPQLPLPDPIRTLLLGDISPAVLVWAPHSFRRHRFDWERLHLNVEVDIMQTSSIPSPPQATIADVMVGRVVILVRDYEEALDFYTQALGARVIHDQALDGTRFLHLALPAQPEGGLAPVGLWLLRAEGEDDARVGRQSGGQPFLVLYTADCQAALQRFTDAGGTVRRPLRETPESNYVHVGDLYGNEFLLVELKSD